MLRRPLAAVLATGLLAISLVRGATAPAAAATRAAAIAGKNIQAISLVGMQRRPVEIDGRLDEGFWNQARFVSDFAQKIPLEGAPPSRRTEVAFAYDEDALYVGARMFSNGADDIQKIMTRRDESGNAERIIVSFDTFRDRRTAYSFAVTAAGVRVDWYHPDDSEFSRDSSFDPVWAGNAHVTDRGWTAEMRIPFSQLRFPEGAEQSWGVNINRFIPQDNEDIFWVVVPRNETGWSSWFGELAGIERVQPRRRVELLPYVAGDAVFTSGSLIDSDDPFRDTTEGNARVGGDIKVGLGPALSLDATINPDFGQVEADPAVVNLSAFEIFFQERRPFFIEGAQILQGNGPGYFYSRRIGEPPRGAISGDFTDVPNTTRILAAAKVTGRLGDGWTIGALTALTDDVVGRSLDVETDEVASVPLEPLAGYGVFRVQKELNESASVVGASFTSVLRNNSDPLLREQFANQAYAGGADWILRFFDNQYQLSGHAGFSFVEGSTDAIADLQESSRRFFQRPDQDHVSFDPTRTSLAGWSGRLALAKRAGNWQWNTSANFESPGFEINDAGQLQAADDIDLSAGLRYQDNRSGKIVNTWSTGVNAVERRNFGNVRQPLFGEFFGNVTFSNFASINAGINGTLAGFDDTLTRGGPLAEIGPGWGAFLGASTNRGARSRLEFGADFTDNSTAAEGFSTSLTGTFHPLDQLRLQVSPRYSRVRDNRQYIDTLADGRPETFGNRYLFGAVDLTTVAMQTRLQYAFSPYLILEVYAEPFASSGRFSRYGELEAASSRDLRRYGQAPGTDVEVTPEAVNVTDGMNSFSIDNPDFTVLSMRSTVVLRWEFILGSTLFLVWQQNRSDFLSSGARANLDDLADSITAPGANTLAVKLSYFWMPRF